MSRRKRKRLSDEERRRRSLDGRLRKKYGISLEEYEDMFKKQKGRCAICRRKPKKNRLAVDHRHRFNTKKLITKKRKDGRWTSFCCDFPTLRAKGQTKSQAIRRVRFLLKRLSVRGLLCFPCNAGLRKYGDDYRRMLRAYKYLKRFKRKCDAHQ